ncbi:MAG: hypothetical protein KAI72_07415, partial [Candidatus Pacebacteria bacterium]|nr:hypothetical protein [Candidatus Paceibacterota bacterium]
MQQDKYSRPLDNAIRAKQAMMDRLANFNNAALELYLNNLVQEDSVVLNKEIINIIETSVANKISVAEFIMLLISSGLMLDDLVRIKDGKVILNNNELDTRIGVLFTEALQTRKTDKLKHLLIELKRQKLRENLQQAAKDPRMLIAYLQQVIENNWGSFYLTGINELRNRVSFVGRKGQDPFTEYKREAANLFADYRKKCEADFTRLMQNLPRQGKPDSSESQEVLTSLLELYGIEDMPPLVIEQTGELLDEVVLTEDKIDLNDPDIYLVSEQSRKSKVAITLMVGLSVLGVGSMAAADTVSPTTNTHMVKQMYQEGAEFALTVKNATEDKKLTPQHAKQLIEILEKKFANDARLTGIKQLGETLQQQKELSEKERIQLLNTAKTQLGLEAKVLSEVLYRQQQTAQLIQEIKKLDKKEIKTAKDKAELNRNKIELEVLENSKKIQQFKNQLEDLNEQIQKEIEAQGEAGQISFNKEKQLRIELRILKAKGRDLSAAFKLVQLKANHAIFKNELAEDDLKVLDVSVALELHKALDLLEKANRFNLDMLTEINEYRQLKEKELSGNIKELEQQKLARVEKKVLSNVQDVLNAFRILCVDFKSEPGIVSIEEQQALLSIAIENLKQDIVLQVEKVEETSLSTRIERLEITLDDTLLEPDLTRQRMQTEKQIWDALISSKCFSLDEFNDYMRLIDLRLQDAFEDRDKESLKNLNAKIPDAVFKTIKAGINEFENFRQIEHEIKGVELNIDTQGAGRLVSNPAVVLSFKQAQQTVVDEISKTKDKLKILRQANQDREAKLSDQRQLQQLKYEAVRLSLPDKEGIEKFKIKKNINDLAIKIKTQQIFRSYDLKITIDA